jgi:hypothetical protein
MTGMVVEERRAEAVGRTRAMTVTRRRVFIERATSLLKNCSLRRAPPAQNATPVLRRLVVRMLPTRDVFRISTWLLVKRKIEQIRNTAFLFKISKDESYSDQKAYPKLIYTSIPLTPL